MTPLHFFEYGAALAGGIFLVGLAGNAALATFFTIVGMTKAPAAPKQGSADVSP